MASQLNLHSTAVRSWSHGYRRQIGSAPVRAAAIRTESLQDHPSWAAARRWTRLIMWFLANVVVIADLLLTFGPKMGI